MRTTNWSATNPLKSERLPGRPLGDLVRRAQRSLSVAVLIFLLVAGGLIAGARLLPEDCLSSAVLMITARDGDVTRTTPTDAATRSALVDAGVEALNSPAMTDRISAEIRRRAGGHAAALAGASGAGSLADRVKARRRGESYLVDVEARAATPEAAKIIAEAAIDTYQDRQLDQRFAALGGDHAAPPGQAADAPKAESDVELARLEAEKARLLATTVQPLPPSVALDPGKAQALAQARSDAAALKTLLRSEVTSEDTAAFRASGVIDRLGDEGAGLTRELLAYETAMSAPADDPAKAENVKFHKYQILTEATRATPMLDARVSRLSSTPGASPTAAPTPSPDTIARLKLLDLQIEAQHKLAEAVAASRPAPQRAATAGAIDFDVRVVSRPSPGAVSIWRQPLILYSSAIVIALIVAVLFAALMTLASNTVTNPRDAAALAGAPVVALAPRIASGQLRRMSPSERHPANIVTAEPASPFADAMRAALASVRPSEGRPEPVCVAIAGAQAGDGASTVSLALARTAAAGGVRVLLIDTDFEDAGLTKAMGIEPAAGIEAIVDGGRQLMDLVVEDDMTSVHLLPSAPSETSRGALSLTQLNALKAALVSAKNAYEMIIIDCQPHSTRSRTRSMARMADIALIVASCDVTRRDMLNTIARRTQQNGATLRGVVFNLAPNRAPRSSLDFATQGEDAAVTPLFAKAVASGMAAPSSIH